MYCFKCEFIKNDKENVIVKLKNDIYYKGLLILEKNNTLSLEQNNEYFFYVINYWNEFEFLYLFFETENLRNIFEELLKIKQIGIKTAKLIFLKYNYEEFLKIIKNYDVISLQEVKGLGNLSAKLIIEHINKFLFDRKINCKQEKILKTLQKLGYKYNLINNVMKGIDCKLSEENMLSLAIKGLSDIEKPE